MRHRELAVLVVWPVGRGGGFLLVVVTVWCRCRRAHRAFSCVLRVALDLGERGGRGARARGAGGARAHTTRIPSCVLCATYSTFGTM